MKAIARGIVRSRHGSVDEICTRAPAILIADGGYQSSARIRLIDQ